MNRPAAPVFLAGLLGAVAGVAATLALAPGRDASVPPTGPGAAELRHAFESALGPLRADVARGFDGVRADLRDAGGPPTETPEGAGDAGDHRRPDWEPPDAAAPTVRPSGSMLPPPRSEDLEALRSWKDDPAVRRTWLFASESELLERFGTPDEVNGAGLQENWIWYRKRGNQRVGRYILVLNKGRLVNYFYQGD